MFKVIRTLTNEGTIKEQRRKKAKLIHYISLRKTLIKNSLILSFFSNKGYNSYHILSKTEHAEILNVGKKGFLP